ncbi:MAG TPA: TlpA disulfide reductase family protein [Candidatus Acidoferrales bacterium]
MRTPWARLVAFAAFAVVLAATFFLGRPRAAAATPGTNVAPQAGDPALIDLDTYKNIVGKYRGKGVMVSFWATWCAPCRSEYPMIVSLAKEYEHQGLAVVGVSLDENADLEPVRRFLSENRPNFPNFRVKFGIDADAFYQGVNPEWRGAMPQTDFYGRDGHLARYFVGSKGRDAYVQAIRLILLASHN